MRKYIFGKKGRFIALLFLLFLSAVLLINLFTPDKEISETENRALAGKPELSSFSFTDDSFSTSVETYLSDQFAGRDIFRSIGLFFNWLGGNRLQSGVYLGKNGQLLEEIQVPSSELLESNVNYINSIYASHPETAFSLLLVPDAAAVYPEVLPAFAAKTDQPALFEETRAMLAEGINFIDVYPTLQAAKEERIYYKTDHHWTSLGAYKAYWEFCSATGLTFYDYTSHTVSSAFNGSLSRLSGFCMKEKETMEIYVPSQEENILVNYVDEQKKTSTLYDTDMLGSSDEYSLFLGGNSSIIDIKTTADSGKTLLIIKDSFANCFIPFLTQNYSRIIVMDPRYYHKDPEVLFDTYHISDVLLLMSGNTFYQNSLS